MNGYEPHKASQGCDNSSRVSGSNSRRVCLTNVLGRGANPGPAACCRGAWLPAREMELRGSPPGQTLARLTFPTALERKKRRLVDGTEGRRSNDDGAGKKLIKHKENYDAKSYYYDNEKNNNLSAYRFLRKKKLWKKKVFYLLNLLWKKNHLVSHDDKSFTRDLFPYNNIDTVNRFDKQVVVTDATLKVTLKGKFHINQKILKNDQKIYQSNWRKLFIRCDILMSSYYCYIFSHIYIKRTKNNF